MIKFIIRLLFGKAILKRNQARKHNAIVLQELLDKEHNMRDTINKDREQNWTTKDAIIMANAFGYNGDEYYNSHIALRNADFRAEI